MTMATPLCLRPPFPIGMFVIGAAGGVAPLDDWQVMQPRQCLSTSSAKFNPVTHLTYSLLGFHCA